VGKVRRERLFLVGLFAVVPIVALLLSASRGGIISFAVELVILFSLLLVRRLQSKYMLAGGVLVLCAILAVSWIGVQEVLQRFSNYESLDVTIGKRASCGMTLSDLPGPPGLVPGWGRSRWYSRPTNPTTMQELSTMPTTTIWRSWRKRVWPEGFVAFGSWRLFIESVKG